MTQMEDSGMDKLTRILGIYTRLRNGGVISKAEEAERYGVSLRSVQRDIDELRSYFEDNAEEFGYLKISYDKKENGYKLTSAYTKLNFDGNETLAISKILLDSRALSKKAMESIVGKIIDSCKSKDRATVREMLKNELYHYVQPQHDDEFMKTMWQLAQAIKDRNYIDIKYKRPKDGKTVKRRLLPAAIMFSEFYFYLAAYIQDKEVREAHDLKNSDTPTVYRIDRFVSVSVSKEKYSVDYKERFQEGEFRKRIQFMFTGELCKVQFTYTGDYPDTVLDRLPTAKLVSQKGKRCVFRAEGYKKGLEMWLASQKEMISEISYS